MANGNTTIDGSKAALWTINDGQLSSGNLYVTTSYGTAHEPFAVANTIGTISTTFAVQNGIFYWNNSAFDGNTTQFYKVPGGLVDNAQVVARFSGPIDPSWAVLTLSAVPATSVASPAPANATQSTSVPAGIVIGGEGETGSSVAGGGGVPGGYSTFTAGESTMNVSTPSSPMSMSENGGSVIPIASSYASEGGLAPASSSQFGHRRLLRHWLPVSFRYLLWFERDLKLNFCGHQFIGRLVVGVYDCSTALRFTHAAYRAVEPRLHFCHQYEHVEQLHWQHLVFNRSSHNGSFFSKRYGNDDFYDRFVCKRVLSDVNVANNVRRLHGGGEQLDDVSVYDRAERNVFVCNRTNCDVNATRLAEWPLRSNGVRDLYAAGQQLDDYFLRQLDLFFVSDHIKCDQQLYECNAVELDFGTCDDKQDLVIQQLVFSSYDYEQKLVIQQLVCQNDFEPPYHNHLDHRNYNNTHNHLKQLLNTSLPHDSFCNIPLPFSMNIYGQQDTTAYASTNGYISILSGSSQYQVEALPDSHIPNNTVAAFFDDLYLVGASNPQQGIFYAFGKGNTNVTFEYYVGRNGTSQIYHFLVDYDSAKPGVFVYTYIATGGASDQGIYAGVGTQGVNAAGNEVAVQYSLRSADITPGLVVTCDTTANTCVTTSKT
ncbi:hypothetical protein B0A50_06009 [Salinomyces thailandicus]|uniref:DUF7908 domain-containing protein n=1 Tax=Salinomyces thailandicus TaxID=706561 RepID=A0A4U0TR55_9PEZI|nr:hypothetical protein B0A50_06009 [Salinomyces thailandica]